MPQKVWIGDIHCSQTTSKFYKNQSVWQYCFSHVFSPFQLKPTFLKHADKSCFTPMDHVFTGASHQAAPVGRSPWQLFGPKPHHTRIPCWLIRIRWKTEKTYKQTNKQINKPLSQLSQQPHSALRISLHGPSATASRVLHQTFCNSYCWWLTPLMLCITQQWFCQIYIYSYINMTCCYYILPSCATNINKIVCCLSTLMLYQWILPCVVKDPCHIRWLMWPPGRHELQGFGAKRGSHTPLF